MIFSKIKEAFSNKFSEIFNRNDSCDEVIDEIEELLILSDVGVNTTSDICESLRKDVGKNKLTSKEEILSLLKEKLVENLELDENEKQAISEDTSKKQVILVVGVNGVGKTTSIAKLTNRYIKNGKKVLLAAGDTFRAGAVEQLDVWAKRLDTDIVKGKDGADPASVIYDAAIKFKNDNYDVLICDTAGRLHNKKNLMDEIDKIKRTIDKNLPDVNLEVYIVIDATTGQNAVIQAKAFYERTSINGVILTKLDSSAKGGVVFRIIKELNIPIKYIGVGEKIDDFKEFDAKEFVNAII